MNIPAHKVIGDKGKPGQISFDRYPYMKHSTADQTLGDYIARKSKHDALTAVNNEKKLTFDEWFNDRCGSDTYTQQEDIKSRMQWAWEAAQENK